MRRDERLVILINKKVKDELFEIAKKNEESASNIINQLIIKYIKKIRRSKNEYE